MFKSVGLYEYGAPRNQTRGHQIPQELVTGGCELPDLGAGNWELKSLIAEPSPGPLD